MLGRLFDRALRSPAHTHIPCPRSLPTFVIDMRSLTVITSVLFLAQQSSAAPLSVTPQPISYVADTGAVTSGKSATQPVSNTVQPLQAAQPPCTIGGTDVANPEMFNGLHSGTVQPPHALSRTQYAELLQQCISNPNSNRAVDGRDQASAIGRRGATNAENTPMKRADIGYAPYANYPGFDAPGDATGGSTLSDGGYADGTNAESSSGYAPMEGYDGYAGSEGYSPYTTGDSASSSAPSSSSGSDIQGTTGAPGGIGSTEADGVAPNSGRGGGGSGSNSGNTSQNVNSKSAAATGSTTGDGADGDDPSASDPTANSGASDAPTAASDSPLDGGDDSAANGGNSGPDAATNGDDAAGNGTGSTAGDGANSATNGDNSLAASVTTDGGNDNAAALAGTDGDSNAGGDSVNGGNDDNSDGLAATGAGIWSLELRWRWLGDGTDNGNVNGLTVTASSSDDGAPVASGDSTSAGGSSDDGDDSNGLAATVASTSSSDDGALETQTPLTTTRTTPGLPMASLPLANDGDDADGLTATGTVAGDSGDSDSGAADDGSDDDDSTDATDGTTSDIGSASASDGGYSATAYTGYASSTGSTSGVSTDSPASGEGTSDDGSGNSNSVDSLLASDTGDEGDNTAHSSSNSNAVCVGLLCTDIVVANELSDSEAVATVPALGVTSSSSKCNMDGDVNLCVTI
ncbi:uncharacterized protein B0H18DRAFT_1207100 [Fomitopsis serialis]|uniref:uncharacterized protein n=1 Tax=Fomitopsis serialis TaxID=139415 RepID=UPI0020081F48|nr:uncharacterized protein B0H18DRAFT_1207100 [Neoantrodia serialis]KAH9935517.1 hypothetical protein B0H18DRAFT_1207100 [Neoantrodia serialis]